VIVADVNLVAYLVLGGPEQSAAQRVFTRDPEWAAPLLWRSEFRSVLAGYIRQRGLSVTDAARAHALAEALLANREYMVQGDRVLTIVAGSTCSAYDCEYLALAEQLAVPLVTADRAVVRAFPNRAVSPEDFAARPT
jgi:predicted nucleic acid-binding protein